MPYLSNRFASLHVETNRKIQRDKQTGILKQSEFINPDDRYGAGYGEKVPQEFLGAADFMEIVRIHLTAEHWPHDQEPLLGIRLGIE